MQLPQWNWLPTASKFIWVWFKNVQSCQTPKWMFLYKVPIRKPFWPIVLHQNMLWHIKTPVHPCSSAGFRSFAFAQESLNAGTYTNEPLLKTKLSISDLASKLDALAAKIYCIWTVSCAFSTVSLLLQLPLPNQPSSLETTQMTQAVFRVWVDPCAEHARQHGMTFPLAAEWEKMWVDPYPNHETKDLIWYIYDMHSVCWVRNSCNLPVDSHGWVPFFTAERPSPKGSEREEQVQPQ